VIFKHKLLPEKWNNEILTLADFEAFCAADGVLVREVPAESAGCYLHMEGVPVIFLRSNLRGLNKLRVALHELGHHWLHVPGADNSGKRSYCNRYGHLSKAEHEAKVIETCGVLPLPIFRTSEPAEIADLYGYPRELIQFRERVFRYYNF